MPRADCIQLGPGNSDTAQVNGNRQLDVFPTSLLLLHLTRMKKERRRIERERLPARPSGPKTNQSFCSLARPKDLYRLAI
jgi:hypothetical protein